MLEEGLNIDVSTGGELAVAIAAGAPGARIVLHGNNKSDEELNTAIKRRVRESSLIRSTRSSGSNERSTRSLRPGSVSVLVRVNPGIEAHTHDFVATGRLDSKFGFPLASGVAERALDVLRRLPGVDVVGLHAHIGSQIFRVDSFERLVQSLKELIERFELAELSVGGGLAVAYLTDEVAPSITQWADAVLGAGRVAGLPGSVGISAEPGRDRGDGGDYLLPDRDDQADPRGADLRCRRRRDERQPAPGVMGADTRRSCRAASNAACRSLAESSESTASPATSSSPTRVAG